MPRPDAGRGLRGQGHLRSPERWIRGRPAAGREKKSAVCAAGSRGGGGLPRGFASPGCGHLARGGFLPPLLPLATPTSHFYPPMTYGVTGELNYAFHVNHLPHWTNWQGGPPEFGKPIHPTRQLLEDLPVFEFGAPFKSTYPPYNNMAYWYQGFSHFFSLRLQILAVIRSSYFLAEIIKDNPFFFFLFIAFCIAISSREYRL